MSSSISARDVLDELDDDAANHAAFFPDFDHGYYYHVDARLTAYGSDSRWVIAIEQLAVNPRSGVFGGIATTIYYHGNAVSLPPQPGWGDRAVRTIAVVKDGPSGPLLTAGGSEVISPAATDIRIRGEVVPIRTDENYYWARKIEVERLTGEQVQKWIDAARRHLPPDAAAEKITYYQQDLLPRIGKFELRMWHLVRGLVPEHREGLMATEAERRRGVPADLPMLIQLDDWEHPRLMDNELPRGSESFKQLARVIAENDPTLYRVSEGNVHWSNWPNSGDL